VQAIRYANKNQFLHNVLLFAKEMTILSVFDEEMVVILSLTSEGFRPTSVLFFVF